MRLPPLKETTTRFDFYSNQIPSVSSVTVSDEKSGNEGIRAEKFRIDSLKKCKFNFPPKGKQNNSSLYVTQHKHLLSVGSCQIRYLLFKKGGNVLSLRALYNLLCIFDLFLDHEGHKYNHRSKSITQMQIQY